MSKNQDITGSSPDKPAVNISIDSRDNKGPSVRAAELLKQNPYMSRNDLINQIRAEGMMGGQVSIGRVYQKHRKNLSRGI